MNRSEVATIWLCRQEKHPLNWQHGVRQGSRIRLQQNSQSKADGNRPQFSPWADRPSTITLFFSPACWHLSISLSFLSATVDSSGPSLQAIRFASSLFRSCSTPEEVGRAKCGFKLNEVMSSYVYNAAPTFLTKDFMVLFMSSLNFSGFRVAMIHLLLAVMPDLFTSS